MPNMIDIIKEASLGAVENSKPMIAIIGVVENIEPLTIRIDQKSILEQDDLILTKNVVDYNVDMTIDHVTEVNSSLEEPHSHDYKGDKSFKIHNALEVNDSVILLRVQGDQRYIVLDKVMDYDTTSS